MMCLMNEVESTPSDDASAIASAARGWFEANWDPDLTLGEWWQRLARNSAG